ncbi:PspC domain-containing protein [Streptomyces wuyuanensis]|uniref:Phage shock protein PspC (Stress-responsive transcriptional regulator) n=1 Tax=Streptomyces wuyuanensis TaxID=1196353 RepID=A0A1G9VE41_9ACTN|nr:PspC domain-containing protein [Streptomyces wuyuanensis]SDM70360.1 Phage shock protein PspC (stress-responsive transcriptional regulator) [Streptomyces wuyuanensis]
MTQPTAPAPGPPPEHQLPPVLLRRTARHKVVGGVCGGLGRYCDVDPVIFRIAMGVLSVTGGIGLIFYGFAWLLIPLEGEEENEARRALSGRVDGAALVAVLLALLGCGLFLSMLGNDGTLAFSALLSLAVVGAAVWSRRRTTAAPDGGPLDGATAHAVAEAPPEAKAPPTPDSPSWWRDPIVKDGTTGPVATGYLWGPPDASPDLAPLPRGRRAGVAARRPRGPRGIAGVVFLLALVAGGLGTGLTWDSQPLGTSLQIGLACALAVFGLGLVVGSLLGRIGGGTILLTVVTSVLLVGASVLPKQIDTQWMRTEWRPATAAAVAPQYQLGSGMATLDLSRVAVPVEETVSTKAEVGAGRLRVVLPGDATVRIRARAGVGDVRLPGDPVNDVDVAPDRDRTRTLAPPAGAKPAGTLDLDLAVALGQVEVTRAAS